MKKQKKEDVSICLNCYKIRFKEKFKDNYLGLNDVFGTDDLVNIAQKFINTIDNKTFYRNRSQDRILYLNKILEASKRKSVVAGILMKGHNGPETSIDELIKNEVKTVGRVTKDQFNCHPYFFLLYVNKKDPTNILFLAQSYRQYGFKEVFEEAFRDFVKANSVNESKLEFNTLSVATLFEKYIKDGKLYKLRFIKHGLMKGAEGIVMGDKVEKKKNYEMQLSVKSNAGFFNIKPNLKYNDASFVEQIQIEGFEFEEAYADVIVGGRKRVLNLSKPKEFSAAYDITKEVAIDSRTKLPNFTQVLSEAMSILNNDLIPYV